MTITIHSTMKIVEIEREHDTIPARLWEGVTESGTPVHCYVTRICPTCPPTDPRCDEFAAQLKECTTPTVPGIPLRMIL